MLIAILIAVLLRCDFRPAAHWLLRTKKYRRKFIAVPTEEVLAAALEDMFLGMNLQELVELQSEETSPLTARQFAVAKAVAAEFKLAHWLHETNIVKGTPVRSPTMAKKYEELFAVVAGTDDHVPIVSANTALKGWAFRYRKRNGCTISCLRKSEPAERDEALDKAFPPIVSPQLPGSPTPPPAANGTDWYRTGRGLEVYLAGSPRQAHDAKNVGSDPSLFSHPHPCFFVKPGTDFVPTFANGFRP